MPTREDVADIFDGYLLAEAGDEMFAAPGEPRAAYDALVSVLQSRVIIYTYLPDLIRYYPGRGTAAR